MLAGRLDGRQRSARCIRIPERAEVRPGNAEESRLAAFHARRHSCQVVGDAVFVVAQTQVQCEVV